MIRVTIHDAKTNLSKYLAQLKKEKKIILCRHNIPIAEIVPIENETEMEKRQIGLAKGEFTVPAAVRILFSQPENPVSSVPKKRQDHRIEELRISEEAGLHRTKLPVLHKDPFDRLLVGQGLVTGLTILTPDPLIRQYPVKVLWQ